jgi:hypothetical protein
MPIMHFNSLIQIRPGLSLNTLGPFPCFHQWDYTIPLDRGFGLRQMVYSGHNLVCIKMFNNLEFVHLLIMDAYHHLFSCWIGFNVLSSSRQGCHKKNSPNLFYYYVHHISQHECVITIQLLGLLGDGLINNGVLLQKIGHHLSLHHPQCFSFIIVVKFIVFPCIFM